MKKRKWFLIAALLLVMSVALAPVGAVLACGDFTVDCTGVSTFGEVPAGSTYTLWVRLFDHTPPYGTKIYEASYPVYGGDSGAPFTLQVPWPYNPNGLLYTVVILDEWGHNIGHIDERLPIECAEGCTPGGWQGGNLSDRWNVPGDPDFNPPGGNDFGHDTEFNSFFTPWGSLGGLTMFDLVSTGGKKDNARKAARSLVAAYLNASHADVNYPKTTGDLVGMWAGAVASGTFLDLHIELDMYNNYGCQID